MQWFYPFSYSEINKRLDATDEILSSDFPMLAKLEAILSRLPDMEKGLGTILHQKVKSMQRRQIVVLY